LIKVCSAGYSCKNVVELALCLIYNANVTQKRLWGEQEHTLSRTENETQS